MKSTCLSDFEVLDFIGEGSFARVSKVRYKPTAQIYVWKELDYGKMSDKEKQMLVDEVNILSELNHPNIVKYYDRIIDHQNKRIYIIQEYCDAGDLAMIIKDHRWNNKKIPEDFIWTVLSEIASALQSCHQKHSRGRVLHRDLKPSNIFFSSLDGRPNEFKLTSLSAKLGDFGLARFLGDESLAQTHVGTPFYMSPEKIKLKSYDEKSDIWALGCILYEMTTLQPPFRASRYTQLSKKILKGEYKHFGSISRELATVISSMLKVHSLERPAITDILKLPRVQLATKSLEVERRFSAVKKMEAVQRKKEKEILQLRAKLTREQKRLIEEKRRLQEQELDLWRHQTRLKKLKKYLRRQSPRAGLARTRKPEYSMLSNETSLEILDESVEDTLLYRDEGSALFNGTPAGGLLDENSSHMGSVSGNSTFKSGSTPSSQEYQPPPEKSLFENVNNLTFTLTSKLFSKKGPKYRHCATRCLKNISGGG